MSQPKAVGKPQLSPAAEVEARAIETMVSQGLFWSGFFGAMLKSIGTLLVVRADIKSKPEGVYICKVNIPGLKERCYLVQGVYALGQRLYLGYIELF